MWQRSLRVKIVIIAALFIGAAVINLVAPKQHLPWRALDPAAPLGWGTKAQFMRLSLSPSSVCMDMASTFKPLRSTPADPHRPNKTCGWTIARNVSGAHNIRLAPDAAQMQCPLSIGAALWIREIAPLSREYFGQEITKIHHFGTYSCRRQNGNNSGQWSEHAFANAWDVTGFELSDGDVISIQNDWSGKDETRREFLRAARNKACKIFKVTLSPDFNAAHHDHFHFDMGPSSTCR